MAVVAAASRLGVVMAAQEPRRAGRKSGFKSPVTWVIVLGIAVVGGAYILYRRSQASTAAAATTAATGSSTGTDWSGAIATLQTEIADLQSSQAQEQAGETGGGTSGGGGTAGGGTSGGGGGTPGTDSRGTGGPPVKAGFGKPAMPLSVRVTGTTATSVSLRWSPSPGATSYRIRLTYQGKLAKQQTATGTTTTIGGLTPNHTYTVHVAAVGKGGTSAETNGPAAKTKRGGAAPKAAAHSVVRRAA